MTGIVYAHQPASTKNDMKTKLPKDIQSLVNLKSHELGISYAEQIKQQLLNELETMRAKGATLEELEKYIDNRPPPISGASIS